MRSKDVQPSMNETGTPINLEVYSQDSNELFTRNDKVNLVGKLAAGVAHEIRNPLTTIKGFVQLLDMGVSKPEYFSIINSELNRVEEIIDKLKGLSEPSSIKFHPNDIRLVLEQAIMQLKELCLSKGIEIATTIEAVTSIIFSDGEQLKQVFVNVIKNAIEATAPNKKLFISCTEIDHQFLITIRDQGVGISQERISHLFEPFYCIKENGTGLGLMVSYKIIKEHQGTIHIESETGVGTTVAISLPLLTQRRAFQPEN